MKDYLGYVSALESLDFIGETFFFVLFNEVLQQFWRTYHSFVTFVLDYKLFFG